MSQCEWRIQNSEVLSQKARMSWTMQQRTYVVEVFLRTGSYKATIAAFQQKFETRKFPSNWKQPWRTSFVGSQCSGRVQASHAQLHSATAHLCAASGASFGTPSVKLLSLPQFWPEWHTIQAAVFTLTLDYSHLILLSLLNKQQSY